MTHRNTSIRDGDGTDRETLARQAEMFRLAERDHGLNLAAIALETHIDKRTLQTYNNSNIFARAKMPLWVFVELCKVIPDDCTSIMLEPASKHVGSNVSDDGDLEADGKVTPIEKRKLKDRARRVAARAQAVAA